MRTILCPVDFSETSIKALLYAYDIALQQAADLLLLHTYHIPKVVALMEEYQQPDLGMQVRYEREALEKMDNLIIWLNKIHAPGGVKATFKAISNFAADEIIKTAYEEDIELIVLGTKTIKDLKSIFIGTNTVRVIEETRHPVLIIPSSAPYTKISHILYASYQPQEEELRYITNFANIFNAPLTLVNLREKTPAMAHQGRAVAAPDFPAGRVHSSASLETTGQPIQQTIGTFIEQHPATLLAISANRRHLLDEVISENNAGQISYPLCTPVLILK